MSFFFFEGVTGGATMGFSGFVYVPVVRLVRVCLGAGGGDSVRQLSFQM